MRDFKVRLAHRLAVDMSNRIVELADKLNKQGRRTVLKTNHKKTNKVFCVIDY